MTWYCRGKPITDVPPGYISGLFCQLSDSLGSDKAALKAVLEHEMMYNPQEFLNNLTGLLFDCYSPGGNVEKYLSKWTALPTRGNFEPMREYGKIRVVWRER